MECRWVGSGTLVAYKGLEFHGIIGEDGKNRLYRYSVHIIPVGSLSEYTYWEQIVGALYIFVNGINILVRII